ncbi:hypothetical protein, partial [Streptomyces shenzhenensis]|uniref:hypothetical protein n=1 Tax=Streptomyces shenzhenensis TaxID=943815 RepID=UPI001C689799
MQPRTTPDVPTPRDRRVPDRPVRCAADVLALAERVFRWADTRDWSGPDPYDGLTGPLGRLAGHRVLRQALLQTVKRSPADLRPLLRIRPRRPGQPHG